ncbi:SufS family cysteine desulfurase [Marinobacterium arenosum]|uniref:SufS family cysteine desulfurase n=1 Tax=Marinobacterium arenosum TaxID=2862496 RepID=UPI001C9541A6|nr:SufS family cysteine desulfurase [Marinobacterium arenosum]MBY4677108.1 SufS family cysteine desulfurase [Marinobacterium arenosum]
MVDLRKLRAEFPLLNRRVNGQRLIYLDNAATAQKPREVIEAVNRFYRQHNANVHRASHALSSEATALFEQARDSVARFLNAPDSREIVWTRGTTEAINLVAQSYGRSRLQPGDEILLTELEHHANIVPWQLLAEQTGATIRVVPIRDNGELDLARFRALLNERTRILAVGHASNALGTINPVAEMIRAAKSVGAVTLVDGAQSAAHLPIDVQALGCDFFAFSGHKAFGPTGIGALWGRLELLEQMPPWQGGGEMIERVSFSGTSYNRVPFRFEAGTPNIAGAIGLAAALDYLSAQDRPALLAHEQQLLQRCLEQCSQINGFRPIGQPAERVSLLSFQLDGLHQQDVGLLLDQQGIAIRTGHHCAMPLMERLGLPGTLRASFAFYNSQEEVDRFAEALQQIVDSQHETVAVCPADPFTEMPYGHQVDAEQLRQQLLAKRDWNSRYREIMLLGRDLPALPDHLKSDDHRLHGCESQAWLVSRVNDAGRLEFLADSDARIIRGLIAIVLAALNNRSAEQVLAFDIDRYFAELDLLRHLSPSRGNGLRALVEQIHRFARQQ